MKQEVEFVLKSVGACYPCSTEKKYLGANVYTHKTAPVLMFFRGEEKENLRQLSNLVMRKR